MGVNVSELICDRSSLRTVLHINIHVPKLNFPILPMLLFLHCRLRTHSLPLFFRSSIANSRTPHHFTLQLNQSIQSVHNSHTHLLPHPLQPHDPLIMRIQNPRELSTHRAESINYLLKGVLGILAIVCRGATTLLVAVVFVDLEVWEVVLHQTHTEIK